MAVVLELEVVIAAVAESFVVVQKCFSDAKVDIHT